MTQTTDKFFDDIAKLMTDAVGAAQGMRSEVENVTRVYVEQMLRKMNVPNQEELEEIRAMTQKSREENESLTQRVQQLEDVIAKIKPKAEGLMPGNG